jgi:DNA mismatch repair ATPase MutS
LAGLPEEVLKTAKRVSEEFEEEMAATDLEHHREVAHIDDGNAKQCVEKIMHLLETGDYDQLLGIWDELNNNTSTP